MKFAKQLKSLAEILMEHQILKEFQIYTQNGGRVFTFTDGLFFNAVLKPTEELCGQKDGMVTALIGEFLNLALDFGDDADILLSDERVIGYPYFSFILGDDERERKVYLEILDYKETTQNFFNRPHPDNHFILSTNDKDKVLNLIRGKFEAFFELEGSGARMPFKLHTNAVVSDFVSVKGVVPSCEKIRFVDDSLRSFELFLERVQSDIKISWGWGWIDTFFAEVSGYLGDGFVTLRYFVPDVEVGY